MGKKSDPTLVFCFHLHRALFNLKRIAIHIVDKFSSMVRYSTQLHWCKFPFLNMIHCILVSRTQIFQCQQCKSFHVSLTTLPTLHLIQVITWDMNCATTQINVTKVKIKSSNSSKTHRPHTSVLMECKSLLFLFHKDQVTWKLQNAVNYIKQFKKVD